MRYKDGERGKGVFVHWDEMKVIKISMGGRRRKILDWYGCNVNIREKGINVSLIIGLCQAMIEDETSYNEGLRPFVNAEEGFFLSFLRM